jgi:soluble lytic murein transglycosylase-like protein
MKGVPGTFLLLALIMPALLSGGLIIRQEKDGRIVLSNTIEAGSAIIFSPNNGSTFIPADYRVRIRQLARIHQLDEDLIIAVAHAESSFNPYAISPKGAIGIMQLMGETAKQYGVDNRFNAEKNLEAGIKHLKYLYDKYKGDLALTLAAYNAGEEAVAKYQGIPPYPETRRYIRRVMVNMGLRPPFTPTFRRRTKIYHYLTADGKVVISDIKPNDFQGKLEIIE